MFAISAHFEVARVFGVPNGDDAATPETDAGVCQTTAQDPMRVIQRVGHVLEIFSFEICK